MSPFRFVAVLVFFLLQCRRYGLSPFWCRRFGVSPFWFVAVLTIDQRIQQFMGRSTSQPVLPRGGPQIRIVPLGDCECVSEYRVGISAQCSRRQDLSQIRRHNPCSFRIKFENFINCDRFRPSSYYICIKQLLIKWLKIYNENFLPILNATISAIEA